ncbi:RICIN domain-containing protein, partial [Sporocytophaga myxococcoides]|uniref:RICIN domain-containing protein n=1 Tax=Sporocytophaga myxococcoides TaxID=153721 RepID=UPI0004919222
MKYFLLAILVTIVFFVGIRSGYSQCSSCSVTVNVSGTTSTNISATVNNQILCITGTGTYTGTINFNSRSNVTLCIGNNVTLSSTATLSNVSTTAIINNYGIWDKSLSAGAGLYQSGVTFNNYGTTNTNTVTLNSNTFNNYGTFNVSSGITVNNNSDINSFPGSVINVTGTVTVNSGGTISLGGVLSVVGSITNNGTIQGNGSSSCGGIDVTGTFTNNSAGDILSNGGLSINKVPSPNTGTLQASVNVNNANPTITTQPSDVSACVGTNATFTVASTPVSNTYQWQVQTGGTGPFSSISGATSSTLTLSNVTAAMSGNKYRVLVYRCPNFEISNIVTLTVSPGPNASISSTNANCNGSSTGTITISSPSGGSGTYQYSINGGTTWQASNSFTGLPAGSYDIRIRDAANTSCTRTLNAAYNITQPVPLNAILSQTNVTCNGASTGSISIAAPSGGGGTYQYSINGTTWQTATSFNGLAAGTYTVRIRDAAFTSCSRSLPSVTITQPQPLDGMEEFTNVTCNGANDGTITISSPSGGGGTYQYSINGGATWQSSGTFTGLSPGTYNVRMRDAAATTCSVSINSSLTITQPPILNGTVTATNVRCYNANDGTITISSPSGGTGSYNYSIDGGANWVSSPTFTGLAPGTYNVQIRDAIIISGSTYKITARNSGKSLNVAGSSMASGADLQQWDYTGALNQQFVIEEVEPGYYRFLAKHSNLALGVEGGSMADVATIEQQTWTNADYQKWFISFDNNGYIKIVAKHSGKAFDITGASTANGVLLIQYFYHGNSNQQWKLDVLSGPSSPVNCIRTLNSAVVITQPSQLTATVSKTNVLCNGALTGSIGISPTGGVTPYEYSINGGAYQTSGSFTGLAAGTYTLNIRDANNCVLALPSQTITQPAVLSATVSKTNVLCNGASSGAISITSPSGGVSPYQYSINGGAYQSTGSFTGLGPGNYTTSIRDANNCVVALASQTIIEAGPLSATLTKTDITCNGGSNGSITITSPSGGISGNYQYSINNGATWQTGTVFTGLAIGSYFVRMRDPSAASCPIYLPGVSISQPGPLNGSVIFTNITCNGKNDGIITITSPTGGSGSYQYTINGGISWQSSSSFTSLSPGTYSVQLRDANNISCGVFVVNNSLTLTQPSLVNGTASSTNVSCYGENNGTIIFAVPTGGVSPYQYSINGGAYQSSGNFSGITAGTYTLNIRDANNCVVALASKTITQPVVLSATVSKINVICNGVSTGAISITSAAGGVSPYQYSINGGTYQSSGSFTGLGPGSYTTNIKDANSCVVALASQTIIEAGPLNATLTKTNVTCNGGSDGSITITSPSGGISGNYQYSINNGLTWQTATVFNGLTSGSYFIRMRDPSAPGCPVYLPGVSITQPGPLNGSVSFTNITCNGNNNGVITINTPSGGSGSYQYTINGGVSWQSSSSFTSLSPGIYNVQLRDAINISCGGFVINNSLTLTEPSLLNGTASSTNVSCYGGNNGTITISSPTGGVSPYQYSINGGTYQSGGNFSNLVAGTYTLNIKDANNCVVALPGKIITEPVVLSATVSKTDVTCNGTSTGVITISSASGGVSPYQYSINGGTYQASGTFTGLAAGSYPLNIRDANNCVVALTSQTISQPTVLSASETHTDALCNGASTGTASISATGGTAPYTGTGTFTGLAAGTHSYTVTDANGCSSTISVVIGQPATLAASETHTDALCNGASTGTATIVATGGTAPYTGTGTFTGLAAGTHSYTVTDANGCSSTISVVIGEPTILTASETHTDALCNGALTGTAIISATGGTAPYTGTGTFTGLAAGTHSYTVTDANGCSSTISVVIGQPTVLSTSETHTDALCNGAS